jgi:hypothetical protein
VTQAATVVADVLASPELRAEMRARGANVADEHRLEQAIAALDNLYAGLSVQPDCGTDRKQVPS